MIEALKAIFSSLNQMRHNGYAYIWANMAFMVLALPMITLPAAYSALMRVGHAAHTAPHESDLALLWETFKENFWRSLLWGLAHALFAVVNFSNLATYSGWYGLRVIWLAAGIVWIGVLLYTWPLYYEMEQPDLWGATRNAVIMVLQNPLFTVVLVMWVSILVVVSTILVANWALLTWCAIAALANAAVMNRLNAYRKAQTFEYIH
jgi:uncharacterized membrane protein YesL